MTKEDLQKIREIVRDELAGAKEIDTLAPDIVAEKLGVSKGTLAQWRHKGLGPNYINSGGKVMYRSIDVADFINRKLVKL